MKEIESRLFQLLAQRGYAPLQAPDLVRRLRLPPARLPEFEQLLAELERAGRIVRIKEDRYIQPQEADLIPGRIRMNRQGKGFLQPDDTGLKEIAIPESATGTALHEDRVLVRLDVRPRGLRPEGGAAAPATGSVVRILERRRTRLVGTLQRGRQFLYVIPDDPRIPHDVYVPSPRDVGRPARVGDKVVVELREWESRHTNPEGEIVEVLGPPDREGVDMLSVLRQYDLPLQFPRQVLDEARAIGTTVREEDLEGRLDCRGHRVITIDPDDAKDFDDAICLEPAGGDRWRLWVHIADVSHYVRPATALDAEASRRGNSTYLVDRVIPMLPEALSNELCSLKPDVDRLTKCVEFLLDGSGAVLRTQFHAAVIRSQRRFTYQEAFAVLQRAPSGPIEEMLHQAHELAQRIRRTRFDAGSLELDFPEMKIRLDEHGRVARIERVENDASHQLIEEYMLLANEAVATRLIQLKRPALHRVHEEPDAVRLAEYQEEVLSHNVPCGDLRKRQEVQRLLRQLSGLPIGPALKIGFLKSLMRARYSVEPLGHFGLAKAKYAHFTSPIRRYADLVVHRALFDRLPAHAPALQAVADHLSTTERNSSDAERDSRDVKLFAFLQGQLDSGQPVAYDALVTDVRNFGFFVDVTGLAMSGLVPLSTVNDDFYVLDTERGHLVGRRSRRIIRLGDRIRVQIAKINRFKKQVDFRLADVAGTRRSRPAAPAPSAARAKAPAGRPERPGSRPAPRPAPPAPSAPPPRQGQPGRPARPAPPRGNAPVARPTPPRRPQPASPPSGPARAPRPQPQPPARLRTLQRPVTVRRPEPLPVGTSQFGQSDEPRRPDGPRGPGRSQAPSTRSQPAPRPGAPRSQGTSAPSRRPEPPEPPRSRQPQPPARPMAPQRPATQRRPKPLPQPQSRFDRPDDSRRPDSPRGGGRPQAAPSHPTGRPNPTRPSGPPAPSRRQEPPEPTRSRQPQPPARPMALRRPEPQPQPQSRFDRPDDSRRPDGPRGGGRPQAAPSHPTGRANPTRSPGVQSQSQPQPQSRRQPSQSPQPPQPPQRPQQNAPVAPFRSPRPAQAAPGRQSDANRNRGGNAGDTGSTGHSGSRPSQAPPERRTAPGGSFAPERGPRRRQDPNDRNRRR